MPQPGRGHVRRIFRGQFGRSARPHVVRDSPPGLQAGSPDDPLKLGPQVGVEVAVARDNVRGPRLSRIAHGFQIGRNSANKGTTRDSWPACLAVLGECTFIRPRCQSTSPHVSAKCSDAQRSPPYRLRAISNCHSASGAASMTWVVCSRLTKYCLAAFPTGAETSLAKRFDWLRSTPVRFSILCR